jgi:hypothetical protein
MLATTIMPNDQKRIVAVPSSDGVTQQTTQLRGQFTLEAALRRGTLLARFLMSAKQKASDQSKV